MKNTLFKNGWAVSAMAAAAMALSLLGAGPSAASETAQASTQKTPPASAPAAQQSTATVLWDHWYTVNVEPNYHYAYYNERVERKKGRLHVQSRMWKQEEGFINEEQLGSFSEDGPELRPIFFNFHSAYRTNEVTIDANVSGKALAVKIRQGTQDAPPIKRVIANKDIFSSFFPVWVGIQLKAGKSRASFHAVLEDNQELAFRAVPGNIRVEKPDEFSQKSGTTKLLVDHNGLKSVWYVENTGAATRIEMRSQHAIVEKVSEKQARAFLGEGH